ncbi:MAG: LysE family translocator [Gammaproteobacteria bacterium]|nr:LysE family translocator [Gammaproteobacteria bacterium]
MDISGYFTFFLIAFGYIASPGPAVFIAINGGASLGKLKTFFLLLGNTAGLGIIALISALGVGSLILKSTFLTVTTTAIGASWLCYLGSRMIASHASKNQSKKTQVLDQNKNHAQRFFSGLMLALTNPKPIIFFVSIYPQFVVSNSTKNVQLLLLGLTFMFLSIVILNVYSFVSNYTVGAILNEYRIRIFNVIFGVIFIVFGVILIIPIVTNI